MEIRKAIAEAMNLAWSKGYKTVFPYQVQAFIDIDQSERNIRRYMAQMANSGEIKRLGERKGYTLASLAS